MILSRFCFRRSWGLCPERVCRSPWGRVPRGNQEPDLTYSHTNRTCVGLIIWLRSHHASQSRAKITGQSMLAAYTACSSACTACASTSLHTESAMQTNLRDTLVADADSRSLLAEAACPNNIKRMQGTEHVTVITELFEAHAYKGAGLALLVL